MSTLTHHVRIGRTVRVPAKAWCPHPDCKWRTGAEDEQHIRELAVAHAQIQGHDVLVDEAFIRVVVEATS